MTTEKPRLEDTHFHQMHVILQARPNDRALRVDRTILEGMMVEIISAAKRLEKVQNAVKILAPTMDFTSEEDPQDTVLSLFKEARDTIGKSVAEEIMQGPHTAYRIELVERINGLVGAPQ